jgi:hypothetical protein
MQSFSVAETDYYGIRTAKKYLGILSCPLNTGISYSSGPNFSTHSLWECEPDLSDTSHTFLQLVRS